MFLLGVLALAFLGLTVLLGYTLAIRARGVLSWMESLAASPVIGIILATWVALLVYVITASLDASILVTSLLMLIVIAWLRPWKEKPYLENQHLPALLITLAAAAVLVYFGLLTYYGGEYHIAFPFYGDAAFHTSLITSLSQGGNYPPQYPFMAGHLLRYTFLIDFYSALLDHLGLGVQWSVVLPDIILLAALFYLLYALGCRFTGKRAGGLITVALVACSGGLEFIQAYQDWIASGQSIILFLATHNLNYTCVFDFNFVVTNFTDIVMAQRAALAGFGAGALIILICYRLYLEKEYDGKTAKTALFGAGVLAGLLPLFHTYTYACVMISTVLLFMVYKEQRWHYFMIPALALAIPQALYISGQGTQSFLRLQPGWMAGELQNIPSFWIMNLGLELFLLLAGLYLAGKRKALFYLPYLAVFLVANVIVFQPWDYDNHKFFSFWLMPSAVFMATALLAAYNLKVVGKPLFAGLFTLSILTGAMVLVFIVAHPYVEYSTDQIYVADWITHNTPANGLFLTGDAPTHPAIALAGRMSYLGYFPWMYTHGVETADRVEAVRGIYNARDQADMLQRAELLNISYIYLGPEELHSDTYTVNQSLFDGLNPVFDWTNSYGERYRIYKL